MVKVFSCLILFLFLFNTEGIFAEQKDPFSLEKVSEDLYADIDASFKRQDARDLYQAVSACTRFADDFLHEIVSQRPLLKVVCSEIRDRLSLLVFEFQSDEQDLKDVGLVLLGSSGIVKSKLILEKHLSYDGAPEEIEKIESRPWPKDTFALSTVNVHHGGDSFRSVWFQLFDYSNGQLKIVSSKALRENYFFERSATPMRESYLKRIYILGNEKRPSITVRQFECDGEFDESGRIPSCRDRKPKWSTIGKVLPVGGAYDFSLLDK